MPGTHHDTHIHGLAWHTHRGNKSIDPKSKIIILLINSIFLTFLISFELLLLFFILLLCLNIYYKANFFSILKKSLITVPLLFSLVLLIFLAYPDSGNLTLGHTIVHFSRIELVFFYFLKTLLFVYNSLLLIESEDSFLEVIYAFDSLKMPKILIIVLLFMYRSTIDLQIEAKRMIEARYIRSYGKKLRSNIETYKVIAYMIGGLLTRSLLRNELRREALLSRGFTGELYHNQIQWSFQGLRLLWLILIFNILILFTVTVKFIPYGVIT